MYNSELVFTFLGLPDEVVKQWREAEPLPGFAHYFGGDEVPAVVAPTAVVVLTPAAGLGIEAARQKYGKTAFLLYCTDTPELVTAAEYAELYDVWPLTMESCLWQYRIRRLLEQVALQRQRFFYRNCLDTIINMLPDLIWFKDVKGAHLKVNDAFCECVAKEKSDVEGRGHYYIWGLSKEMYDKGEFVCLETEQEVLEKKKVCVFDEKVLDMHHHLRELKTWKAPLFDEDGQTLIGTVGFARDVTKEHEQQQQIIEIKKQQEYEKLLKMAAEEANAAKTRFLFNMSHDVRTPMNAILGFTDMAKKNLDSKEKVADYIDKIYRSGQHLLGLINDVLEMSRIESGKVELTEKAIDVRNHRVAMVEMLQNQAAEKNIDLTFETRNLLHSYLAVDALRMDQVLINIISNAIKYTPEGGWVRCLIEHRESAKPGYASVRYTISDNGIGMSKAFVQKIFEPFTRAESATVSGIHGTGLGMSIVKKLLDMMGGSIKVESEPGKGTTVIVDIDLRITDGAVEENVEKNAVDFSGRKVLLVEDNELNMEIAMAILEECGFEVDIAKDGDIALHTISEKGANYYDFILMDIQMPRMDGYEATKEIRKLPGAGKLPIIALSANAFEEDKRKSLEAGMNDHVAKPINVDELKAALAKFL